MCVRFSGDCDVRNAICDVISIAWKFMALRRLLFVVDRMVSCASPPVSLVGLFWRQYHRSADGAVDFPTLFISDFVPRLERTAAQDRFVPLPVSGDGRRLELVRTQDVEGTREACA